MKRIDVFSLVIGMILTGLAAGALWFSITGSLNFEFLKIAAPVALVVIGVLGLILSRQRE